MKKRVLLSFVFLLVAFTALTYFTNLNTSEVKEQKQTITNTEIPKEDSIVKEIDSTIVIPPTNDSLDDLANFIAGIKTEENYLNDLIKDTSWQKYAGQIGKIWNKADTLKYRQMEKWTTAQLRDINSTSFNLFYPFSGPDFLNADIFFPNADTVTMIGLEPVGSLPEVDEDWFKDSLRNYVYGLKKSLKTVLNLSFFKTKDMFSDLRAHELNGAAHLVIWFAKRRGYDMISAKAVALNHQGKLIYKIKGDTSYTRSGIKGMEISCVKGNQLKVIRYFSADISNGGLKRNKRLETFLNTVEYSTTLVKSASYLMHEGNFTSIRNIILKNSENVLQDDTGIPYRFIDDKKWDLTLYGDYEKPINLFSMNYQEDLKKAYDSLETKPLTFGIGYKYRKNESTWMLIQKKTQSIAKAK